MGREKRTITNLKFRKLKASVLDALIPLKTHKSIIPKLSLYISKISLELESISFVYLSKNLSKLKEKYGKIIRFPIFNYTY